MIVLVSFMGEQLHIDLSQSTTQLLKNEMMGVRDYSGNERIRTWQAYGERVALIFQHSLHAYLTICQTFLTSKRPPPGQAVCQISVPDMILKGCLACPSSLPVYTVFLPQGKSTLSHYHEAFVL